MMTAIVWKSEVSGVFRSNQFFLDLQDYLMTFEIGLVLFSVPVVVIITDFKQFTNGFLVRRLSIPTALHLFSFTKHWLPLCYLAILKLINSFSLLLTIYNLSSCLFLSLGYMPTFIVIVLCLVCSEF